jgi:hypothetical protein
VSKPQSVNISGKYSVKDTNAKIRSVKDNPLSFSDFCALNAREKNNPKSASPDIGSFPFPVASSRISAMAIKAAIARYIFIAPEFFIYDS